MDARERAARLELVGFQLGEIDKARLRPGEDDELGARRAGAAPTPSGCRRLCREALRRAVRRRARGARAASPGLEEGRGAGGDRPGVRAAPRARDGVKAQLEDLALFLRDYADGAGCVAGAAAGGRGSPGAARAPEAEARPDARRRAGQGARRSAPERRALEPAAGQRRHLERQLPRRARAASSTPRRDLSRARRTAAGRFARSARRQLADLAMAEHALRRAVRVDRERARALDASGIDRVEFFLSPNPGEDPRPLARIASGGELSRIMLALQDARPRGDQPRPRPLIFDEVDAGIGGRAAEAVGAMLRGLGGATRCCASRTCRRSPPGRTRSARSRSGWAAAGR